MRTPSRNAIAWLLASCLAIGACVPAPEADASWIDLDQAGLRVRIDPATLAVEARFAGRTVVASEPSFPARQYRLDREARSIAYEEEGLRVTYALLDGCLTLRFVSSKATELSFPRIPVPVTDGVLILPLSEGSYVPASDDAWTRYLASAAWDTLEGLSMPFWGVEAGPRDSRVTVTYMVDNPFYNLVAFTPGRTSLGITLTHSFPAIAAWREPLTVTICFDTNALPIAPALRFRHSLEEAHFIIPLVDKIARVPRTGRLIGAVHAYVWSSGPITAWDAAPAAWPTLARRIVSESRGLSDSTGAWIRARLSEADWKVVADAAMERYSYPYLRRELARVLSLLYDMDPSRIDASFGDLLLPPETRGGGISTRLIDDIRAAGIGRMLLTADGWEQVARRPSVAAYAESSGYLLGTYDSFDSVHDPAYAGTDQSWPTAQFGQELFAQGRILDAAGNPRAGFRKIGFKLSPLAARAAVEHRVRSNFAAAPYSYYFVDADAFGDWYDDSTPGRMAGAHDDALARIDRMRWISDTFKVPVGSEGGNYLATPAIAVAEGIFVPVIGFADPDMTSKGSPWYTGAYYPPDGPDVFLKGVPLKESYIHLFVDPRFRVPLYETVFHDSVITSAHWSSSNLKYSNVWQTLALTQVLYQAAPLYHLNLDAFAEAKVLIQASASMFAATHSYSWRYPLESFRYLTEDRLVQESVFGGLHLVANFGSTSYRGEGISVPPRSVLAHGEGLDTVYTP